MNIMQSPNTGVGGKDHGGRRKLYRCGWCGHPTNADGNPLPVFNEADYQGAEQVDGECCREYESECEAAHENRLWRLRLESES